MVGLPAFLLVVMVGAWPVGRVTIHPFTDYTGCQEAMTALSDIIREDYKMFCYDRAMEVVALRSKGKPQ